MVTSALPGSLPGSDEARGAAGVDLDVDETRATLVEARVALGVDVDLGRSVDLGRTAVGLDLDGAGRKLGKAAALEVAWGAAAVVAGCSSTVGVVWVEERDGIDLLGVVVVNLDRAGLDLDIDGTTIA